MATLPADDTDLGTTYSEADTAAIASRNGVYVEQEATSAFAIHQFQNDVEHMAHGARLRWAGRTSYPPALSPVVLQAYHRGLGLWMTVDTDDTTPADIPFMLSARLVNTVGFADEYGIIACRVYQEEI